MTHACKQGVFVLLLITFGSAATIYIPGIPCDPMTLYQLQAGSDILLNDLRVDPSLPRTNAYKYYSDTYFVNYFLQKLANDPGLKDYSNVVMGQNNGIVNGQKNIMFGVNNQISGNHNFVFSEQFNSQAATGGDINHSLVLDQWLIELLKMYYIPFMPSYAIKQWDKTA